jgi:hypothetical protein
MTLSLDRANCDRVLASWQRRVEIVAHFWVPCRHLPKVTEENDETSRIGGPRGETWDPNVNNTQNEGDTSGRDYILLII